MSARPIRTIVVVVVAIAAAWVVARPAFGERGAPVLWRAPMKDGPWELTADRAGFVVTTSAPSVYAFTAGGHPRWRVEVDDVVPGQPAMSADLVVVGGMHSVTALARSDGAVRWRHPTSGSAYSLAVARGEVVVGDTSGTLTALDAVSGVARWSVHHPGSPWSSARVDRATGTVVATWHQGDQPAVRAFDVTTGALRWEASTDRFAAAPAVSAGVVVLAVGDGDRHARVEARDVKTGSVRWTAPVPASFEEAIEPAIAGGAVAVVDHFGVVSLFDLRSGKLRWRHDVADVVLATRVALTRDRVAFTSYAGVLHVLDRRDGHEVQRVSPGRLGGLPVATVAVPRPSRGDLLHGGVLVVTRLREWGIQLRKLG